MTLRILSQQEQILVCIYEHNIRNDPIFMQKLRKIMKDKMCRETVNSCMDMLEDLAMIESDWKHVDELWVRVYYIQKWCVKAIKQLYEQSENPI